MQKAESEVATFLSSQLQARMQALGPFGVSALSPQPAYGTAQLGQCGRSLDQCVSLQNAQVSQKRNLTTEIAVAPLIALLFGNLFYFFFYSRVLCRGAVLFLQVPHPKFPCGNTWFSSLKGPYAMCRTFSQQIHINNL